MAAVPEAFEGPLAREHYLEGEPLTYPALGDARIWLEDHAIKGSLLGRGARVRSGREDVVRRFWDFVEQQARAGAGDVELETLLHLECFDGVVWVQLPRRVPRPAHARAPHRRAGVTDARRR